MESYILRETKRKREMRVMEEKIERERELGMKNRENNEDILLIHSCQKNRKQYGNCMMELRKGFAIGVILHKGVKKPISITCLNQLNPFTLDHILFTNNKLAKIINGICWVNYSFPFHKRLVLK